MRHDYDFPQRWDSLTPEQKDSWYKGERCRRRALRQDTPLARRAAKVANRRERKAQARSETVDVSEWR